MGTRLSGERRAGRPPGDLRPSAAGRSWTVAATNDRLLGERLDELMNELAGSDGRLSAASIARLASLVSAASALRESHSIDAKGRCRRCRGRRQWLWPRQRQACSVYTVLDEFVGYERSPLLHAPAAPTPRWNRTEAALKPH